MISPEEINKIKEATEELLEKMTISGFELEVSSQKNNREVKNDKIEDIIDLSINLKEPQFLIGQNGQTLFSLQKILGIILNKKLEKFFYLKLDINDYQKQKIEYLKGLAKSLADEAVMEKKEKAMFPMPSRERKIIHEELAQRQDIATESRGEGPDRHILIIPR